MGEALWGKDSSPVRWDGPPTSRTDRSGRVKGTRGKGLGVKKGLKAGVVRKLQEKTGAAGVCNEGGCRGGA